MQPMADAWDGCVGSVVLIGVSDGWSMADELFLFIVPAASSISDDLTGDSKP